MFLPNSLSYWPHVSLFRPPLVHCLKCQHCKNVDSIVFALFAFSSDAVHELRILLQNMQAMSTAVGSIGPSKKIVWLLITIQHISDHYICPPGTASVKYRRCLACSAAGASCRIEGFRVFPQRVSPARLRAY